MMDQYFRWTKYELPKLVEGRRIQFPIFQLTYDRPNTLRRARLAGRRPPSRPRVRRRVRGFTWGRTERERGEREGANI